MIKKKKERTGIIIASIIAVCLLIIVIDNYRGIINIAKEQVALWQGCVPVLAYHGFVPEATKNATPELASNQWVDDIEGFEQQMKYLHDNGWTTLTMDEFYAWHRKELEVPEKSCLLTFDDGYYDFYYLVYPILKKYDMNATVFVVGAYTPEQTAPYDAGQRHTIGWDKIREIEEESPGISFESHSYDLHGYDEAGNEPWVTATDEELRSDFAKMKQYGFEYMAYPYGGYNDKMLQAVENADMKLAFTFKIPGYAARFSDPYEIPRQKVSGVTTYEAFVEILEKTQ